MPFEPIDPQSQDHLVEIRYRDLDEGGQPRVEPYGWTSLARAFEVVAIMETEPDVECLTIFKAAPSTGAASSNRRRRSEVFRKNVPLSPTSQATKRLRPSGLSGLGTFD